MLKKVLASRLERKMTNGRTAPCLITCEDCEQAGEDVELVVKFSAGCFEREKNLIREAVAAMLAADIGLPVPEPFLVEVDDAFLSSIADPVLHANIANSSRIAFGLKRLPSGFMVWAQDGMVPSALAEAAAEVLIFDAIIVNSDRRPQNPNCLFNGKEIAIFDHELSLAPDQVLFWKAPWIEGGFDAICQENAHIFAPRFLETMPKNLDRFVAAWKQLPSERFELYCQALPLEWNGYDRFLADTVRYLLDVQRNIEKIVGLGMEKFS